MGNTISLIGNLFGILVFLLLFGIGFRFLSKCIINTQIIISMFMNRIENIDSISEGVVGIEGKAKKISNNKTVVAPFSKEQCLTYRLEVREREYSSKKDSDIWHLIHEEHEGRRFQIEKDSGKITVDPEGARKLFDFSWEKIEEVPISDEDINDYIKHRTFEELDLAEKKRYKFVEYRLDPEETAYVLGNAKESLETETRHIISKTNYKDRISKFLSKISTPFFIGNRTEFKIRRKYISITLIYLIMSGMFLTVPVAIVLIYFGIL